MKRTLVILTALLLLIPLTATAARPPFTGRDALRLQRDGTVSVTGKLPPGTDLELIHHMADSLNRGVELGWLTIDRKINVTVTEAGWEGYDAMVPPLTCSRATVILADWRGVTIDTTEPFLCEPTGSTLTTANHGPTAAQVFHLVSATPGGPTAWVWGTVARELSYGQHGTTVMNFAEYHRTMAYDTSGVWAYCSDEQPAVCSW
jgi:hypothetical protein